MNQASYVTDDVFSGKGDFVGQKVFYAFYGVMVILLTTSAFYNLFSDRSAMAAGETAAAAGNKFYLFWWFLLYGLTGLSFFVTALKRGIRTSFLLATLIVLYVFFSTLWSVSADRSLYFGTMFMAQMLIAYVVAENVSPEKFLKILIATLSVLLVLSLIGFVALPEMTSLVRYGGGWVTQREMNGVFAHKSDAGYLFAALILLLFSARDIGLRWSAFWRISLILLSIVGIILANSATGLMAGLVLGMVYLLFSGSQRSGVWFYLLGFGLFGFSLIVPYIDLGQFAELLGRDSSLTGRGSIWESGKLFIAKEIVLGYGYYGFFDKDIFSPVWALWEQFDFFLTPHFHNTGMDVTISLGLVGLGLYSALVFRAFKVVFNDKIALPTRRVLILLLMLFIISSAFDFTLMKHNHFATFFLFYVFFLSFKKFELR